MIQEYYEIFKRNFPYIVREYNKVIEILSYPNNKIIEKRDNKGQLIGISVINKNTIFMLCVDLEYRKRGIGTELLKESEEYIKSKGYDSVTIGVGDEYIMPGIPVRTKPYEEDLNNDVIYSEVNDDASKFFLKHGYSHSWKDCNCFDMRADLSNVKFPEYSIGDTVDGITYRWAKIEDIPLIKICTDDAHKEFTQYYMNENLYNEENNQRVLVAEYNDEICGTLIVSKETEGKGLGSVGCTAVAHKFRGKHIAVNMVVLGTKYLKEIGLNNGFLGYTYSGLDKLYGHAGYKICIYYNMAMKKLDI